MVVAAVAVVAVFSYTQIRATIPFGYFSHPPARVWGAPDVTTPVTATAAPPWAAH